MAEIARKRGRPRKDPNAPPTPSAAVRREKPSGIIERGKSYALSIFLQITGMGSQGLRAARDDGLRVVYVGRGAFVLGDDWLDWLANPQRSTKRW